MKKRKPKKIDRTRILARIKIRQALDEMAVALSSPEMPKGIKSI